MSSHESSNMGQETWDEIAWMDLDFWQLSRSSAMILWILWVGIILKSIDQEVLDVDVTNGDTLRARRGDVFHLNLVNVCAKKSA